MSARTILLTGATGVIGRRVLPLLVAAGHDVTAMGRTPDKRALLKRAGARPIEIDLFDPSAVNHAVQGIDVVINLATHIPASNRAFVPGAWRETNRIRRVVPANLAAGLLAAGRGRLIQESFAGIYQDGGDRWLDETAPTRAARYNRGLLDAEAAAERVTREGGVGIVLRFANFYASDSGFTRDALKYVRGGRAPVFGAPEAYLSSISHDDAATAVIAALDLPAGRYNVVDDRPVMRREYVDSLAAALGVAPPKFFPEWAAAIAGSLGEILSRSQRLSNARLRTLSGWQPATPSIIEGWREVLWDLGQLDRRNGTSGRTGAERVAG